ncbi:MAG: CrcB family protein [Nitriliruptoraceae bacterium]|nr:CrcB family protein [Nitriliruptoraceae bacterium]
MPTRRPDPAPPAPSAARLQVALGGALGASLRVAAILAVGAAGGPRAWAVLSANLAGALLLGVVVGRATRSARLARFSPLLGAGLAGALTSFSSLVVDLAQLGIAQPAVAVTYAVVSLLGGTLLAYVGLRRGRR